MHLEGNSPLSLTHQGQLFVEISTPDGEEVPKNEYRKACRSVRWRGREGEGGSGASVIFSAMGAFENYTPALQRQALCKGLVVVVV